MIEIVLKEVREMMRGYKPFAVLTFYLLFLLAVLYLAMPTNGRDILAMSTFIMLSISVFLSPPIASATISLENERKTLKLLIVTPLRAWDIVIGKLLSALMLVFLLIIPTLPFLSLGFLFGGTSPNDILISLTIALSVSFGLASLSLLISLIFKRIYASNALAYGFVIFFLIGSFIIDALISDKVPRELEGVFSRHLNPFFITAALSGESLANMWWLLKPIWLNPVAIYTAIGFLSLLISLKFFENLLSK